MSRRPFECSIRVAAILFLIIFSSIIIPSDAIAQNVAINNDASLPNASAMLDIKSTTRGVLVPRMTSAQRTAIVSPLKGLLVFDNDTNGFWFYNGSSWTSLSNAGSGWSVSGNNNTDTSVNFVGTTDAKPLILKVNNQRAGVIGFTGNLFLGQQSGAGNTIGYDNIAIGTGALKSNSDRNNTIAIGD